MTYSHGDDARALGTEEGTRDMTWKEMEEGADKLWVEGVRKRGEAAQIVARAGALVGEAPCDDSGQPTNNAAVDWLLMGAEEGTRDMMWKEIEERADKLRIEGVRKGGKALSSDCGASWGNRRRSTM